MRVYKAIPEMSKLHRFSIGQRVLDSSLEMFKWITLVNKARGEERVEMMDHFFVNFEQLRVYLKICSDNKILKLKTLVQMFRLLDNISKQLSGWRAATVRALR